MYVNCSGIRYLNVAFQFWISKALNMTYSGSSQTFCKTLWLRVTSGMVAGCVIRTQLATRLVSSYTWKKTIIL